ncbi:MAG: biotin--[acetyl-CoA-carboxylase] ligase [Candidatus Schekmanbacteria bacterium]|nr:biotin--[acetyl-CoA-carboxylase] ligase [Candidatus Schekmanbacteria bacterium]
MVSADSAELAALPVQLARLLSTTAIGRTAVFLDETGSTNTAAEELERDSAAPEGTVVVALTQTSGRGRHGRPWSSPPKKGLYASFLLRPKVHARYAVAPAMLLAAAACDALAEEGVQALLKWPNDLLVRGHKCGGLLSEGKIQGDMLTSCIVGLGINLLQTAAELPGRPLFSATSLFLECGRAPGLAELLARICNCFEPPYMSWRQAALAVTASSTGNPNPPPIRLQGSQRAHHEDPLPHFPPPAGGETEGGAAASTSNRRWIQGNELMAWRRRADALLAFRGARVRVACASGDVEGVVLGLGDRGELRLAGDDGRERHLIEGDLLLL